MSFPFLYTSLLTPSSPSFTHLFPNPYLPFSIFTHHVLRRSFQPTLLLAPLGLLVFISLAAGLNGDIWRLGIALLPLVSVTDEAGEEGIAPFGVRLWLAITLIGLLWVMIVVGFVRGCQTGRPGSLNVVETGEEGDEWTEEWGRLVGKEGRALRKRAVERWLVRSFDHPQPVFLSGEDGDEDSAGMLANERLSFIPLPPPFNIPSFVLCTLPGIVVGWLDRFGLAERMRIGWEGWTDQVQRWVWRLLAGVIVVPVEGILWLTRREREMIG